MTTTLDGTVFADRSTRAKLQFSGPQRLWFLHQILTQTFEDMRPGDARDSAMITVHGRMTGFLECIATDEAVLAHFEPELRASLPEAIARYVFATQVEIEDVTDDYGLVLVAGPAWHDAVDALRVPVIVHPSSALGVDASYLWVESARLPLVVDELARADARPIGEDELEAIRIANGAPRWGRDMDFKTFPQEAGIDGSAVHFDKGCYLGQEAMAKIHFRGKVNRRLARLETDGVSLRPGAEVVLAGEKVGMVTSASGGNGTALAMLKRTVTPGTQVTVDDERVTVAS